MEIKTIVIPELQKKGFEVHTSIRNMKRMFAYQLAVAKVSDELDEDDVVGQISASLKGLVSSFTNSSASSNFIKLSLLYIF